ncbi:Gfo/Idh/MocA family oxidoreductase [Kitasatospora sp. DSM 101779]|uniref:Gfo/Idh/MocA family oxidoreductase n=1 Tax=Kitasatospora sp. DSM 101779 TaxID=2853165 RepID=UPI0021D89DF5|nr:Gfo/Idh/MocA family oxidoreductase [Kitasatospora sp. DSM 101779]MCU7826343.1 Gfo/Idh/MocA family oxidoreductase [Kitasatospora sp. DSM 101779]
MTTASTPHPEHPALRVGLVGYGLAGAAFHAPLIATTPGLRLDAVVTASPERREQLRREHPQARAVETAEQLLADPSALDLVVVASPNRSHVPLARAALEAGLPVVVDKPLAATAAEAAELADLAETRGLLLTVFQNRRWDADFRTVRQLVADGSLGTVHRYESRFERWRPELKEGWRESADPADAGGILYDLGSHLVDQALTLFGPATHVHAEVDARRAGAAADDDAFVALTHASGVRSHLWMSALAGQLGPRLRVLGDRAAYTVHGMDPQEDALRAGQLPGPGWGEVAEADRGLLGTVDGAARHPSLPGDYPAFYAGVVRALREGADAPVDPRDAVAALAVLEAARRSAAEGRTVALTEENAR